MGNEGLYAHDPHIVEEGHYECRQCGETIRPGHGPGSKPIFRGRYFYLDSKPVEDEEGNAILTAELVALQERKAAENARRVAASLGYPEAFA